MRATLFSLLIIMAAIHMNAADSKIIAPDARLQKLAGDFAFTEGPACDAKGNVFFTDQPNDRIMEWSTEGKLSTFMHPCGRSNGLSFDKDGNLWACADEKNELWRIDPAGKVSEARVVRSIPLLDKAAIDAVRQWEYTPTLLNGEAVPVLVTVTINFAR